jgi:hypothetical protein
MRAALRAYHYLQWSGVAMQSMCLSDASLSLDWWGHCLAASEVLDDQLDLSTVAVGRGLKRLTAYTIVPDQDKRQDAGYLSLVMTRTAPSSTTLLPLSLAALRT